MPKKIVTKYGELIEVGKRMYKLIPSAYELNRQKFIAIAKAKKNLNKKTSNK
jgi:hypothetical protein